jgi:hypothetical protein
MDIKDIETPPVVYARVTVAFDGCRDGEYGVTEFKPGDVLEGDIATSAIQMKTAESCSAADFLGAQESAALAVAASVDGEPDMTVLLAKVAELRNSLDLSRQENDVANSKLVNALAELEKAQQEISVLNTLLATAQEEATAKAASSKPAKIAE